MLHTMQNKIQRVSDLITEYDEGEALYMSPNPALHDFVQKLKAILNGENEITRKVKTKYSNSKSNRTNNASPSSSSSSHSSQIDVSGSNLIPKVIEALGNHVVLTEIFKCCGSRDLKNFRLINKQWKGIANSAIIQKRFWKIRMNDKFSLRNEDRDEDLSDLNDCIEASGGSFPLTALDFTDIEDYKYWNSPALLLFYHLMEPSIKHVKLDNFGPVTENDFQDLLVNRVPNVDHIDVGNIEFTIHKESCGPIVLPYLKTIRFLDNYCTGLFSEQLVKILQHFKLILLAATNLKEILDFPVELMDIFIETGKVGCIQKLNMDVGSLAIMKSTPLYAKLSHTEPKLTSLKITRSAREPYNDSSLSPELAPSLKRILISSKDTLKHLQCVPRFFPVNFHLPKFPNLEFLTLIDSDDWDPHVDAVEPPWVFPARCDCDYSEIFPNLHTVSLDVFLEGRETLFKYFSNQVFPSVKTLEFQSNFQFGGSLKTNFPSVSHIKIIDYERAISSLEEEDNIFRAEYLPNELDNQIESLEFHQCLLARAGAEYELDSIFTGLPKDVVTNLLEVHTDCKSREEDTKIEFSNVKEILLKAIQSIREYAFRKSAGLRRIKIMFNHSKNAFFPMSKNVHLKKRDFVWSSDESSDSEVAEHLTPVISLVSCIYGFSLMPNLEQVIIGYDHYLPNASDIAKVFKPLAQFPYVKIIHEPTITR